MLAPPGGSQIEFNVSSFDLDVLCCPTVNGGRAPKRALRLALHMFAISALSLCPTSELGLNWGEGQAWHADRPRGE
jgi:hypothetical protein